MVLLVKHSAPGDVDGHNKGGRFVPEEAVPPAENFIAQQFAGELSRSMTGLAAKWSQR